MQTLITHIRKLSPTKQFPEEEGLAERLRKARAQILEANAEGSEPKMVEAEPEAATRSGRS